MYLQKWKAVFYNQLHTIILSILLTAHPKMKSDINSHHKTSKGFPPDASRYKESLQMTSSRFAFFLVSNL